MAVTVFLDTSILLAGLIDFGPPSGAAQSILHAVAGRTVTSAGTAWHCCLEFYSVSTRLPAEYRLTPADAARLVCEEVFERLEVFDLPAGARRELIDTAVEDALVGGRIHDAHIAAIARSSGAQVIVTDNRKHFVSSLRHGIRVETASEFSASLRRKKGSPAG
ncbi:MAG TPA: PIN domain-containing protein [Vicinamibacterales bacterium]|nr:PIN domain-containing protein [Vicinamibacterales bacterium]